MHEYVPILYRLRSVYTRRVRLSKYQALPLATAADNKGIKALALVLSGFVPK